MRSTMPKLSDPRPLTNFLACKIESTAKNVMNQQTNYHKEQKGMLNESLDNQNQMQRQLDALQSKIAEIDEIKSQLKEGREETNSALKVLIERDPQIVLTRTKLFKSDDNLNDSRPDLISNDELTVSSFVTEATPGSKSIVSEGKRRTSARLQKNRAQKEVSHEMQQLKMQIKDQKEQLRTFRQPPKYPDDVVPQETPLAPRGKRASEVDCARKVKGRMIHATKKSYNI